ncbi:SDR family oxidoreductase [Truepera radiovictrix]|uniref:Short-chain dehydrogenase/reductase SDR n=1 Tax=Truepera radiovictrix (strain DSM 17093 / CIP 108686 / LMG 22925 / RQ-24) TaxID=649638 RepID=D7CSG0_TRURR|nr:SDR family oxidoreductase [Truepera radiovictrix]ADI15380.1 short-chain dehydrogenase/reductase SDR [Truepera radiovictrix DSM 17093]WMT56069.1 SDR family oxidoreductase [Truepera radiovictrix]
MSTMSGKVALITGAGGGIGRATARLFAERGARVVATDVAEAGLEETAALIRDAGGEVTTLRVDVANEEDVARMVETTVSTYGRLDYAFNNAGIVGAQAPLTELAEADWERVIAVNLKGVFLGLKHELRQLAKQGTGGAIVNTASTAGVVGNPNIAAYTASKHGVIGLTKVAALEHARAGVRVNAICPGVIKSPMTDGFSGGDAAELMKDVQPVGRVGRAEEVAELVLFLCHDAVGYITGQAYIIDGGYTAQ